MSEHYFTSRPTVEHDRRIVESELRGRRFRFVTDAGVFAKAGVDFGSRLLIEALELPVDAQVLDMGCGYGPVGLSAAMLASGGRVTMADVNERALELAAENAKLNGIRNIETVRSDLFAELAGRMFTHIVSNPPIRAGKQIVHRLFEEAHQHLTAGGELWIVIQKKQGAPSAWAKLEQLFGDVREMDKSKGYKIFKAKKQENTPMSG